ncbi:hypothetical protein [Pseudophaeobacter sp. C1-32P7]|uniref:hypothetical protein n=1 Tax=Pseudophaeobacter sp. C1-32P7 TaxID=3098142 RepID=UPI0034D42C12
MSGKNTQRTQAERMVRVIESSRVNVTNEAAAQDAIHVALQRTGLDIAREVRLSARDRIDILSGGVGIEVKVKSRQSRREIFKQLERYAEHDEVQALVLATAAAWPGNISEVKGKPLLVASLTRGWL